jgi:hypothetical protein
MSVACSAVRAGEETAKVPVLQGYHVGPGERRGQYHGADCAVPLSAGSCRLSDQAASGADATRPPQLPVLLRLFAAKREYIDVAPYTRTVAHPF